MNQRLKFNILRGIHERELKQPAQDFRSWKRDFHTEKHIQGKISDLNVGNCACGRVADKKKWYFMPTQCEANSKRGN